MRTLNFSILRGNLVDAPVCKEFKHEGQSRVVVYLRLATDRYAGGKKMTDFHDVVWFGAPDSPLAKLLGGLEKGRLVEAIGELRTRSYTNGDGQTVYRTEVVAREINVFPPFSKPAGVQASSEVPSEAPSEKSFDPVEADLDFLV